MEKRKIKKRENEKRKQKSLMDKRTKWVIEHIFNDQTRDVRTRKSRNFSTQKN